MRIAVIADTHINPTDDVSTSVYLAHRHANRRVQSVINKINSLSGIEAVVHLGDFVHRIQGQSLRVESVRRFHQIMATIEAPLILVPGNHDEGEKVTPWAPGHPVTDESLRSYRDDFGPDYHKIDLPTGRLIILNSQLFGRDDAEERKQIAFLEEALDTPMRTYVFQHHPFFLESPTEREHYDNLPIEVRERYLHLLADRGVSSVFAGHVHNYFYNTFRDMRLFVVPSTTFVRHDYSELFPFVPTDDTHGRNYVSKLGFFIVESSDDREVATWVRTFGCTEPTEAEDRIVLPLANLLRGDRAALGVDLRHDWATPRPIPYTALQDEFNRKLIRNDNFTASLFETGICLLRVPIQDVEEPKTRDRMRDLARLGIKFAVFVFEQLSHAQSLLLNESGDLIAFVEFCAPMARIDVISMALASSGLEREIRRCFAEMGTSASAREAMAHYIWTGFDARRDDLRDHLDTVRASGFDLAVLRVERNDATPDQVLRIADACAEAGIHGVIYARLASTNGAETIVDDVATARLVAMLEILGRVRAADVTVIVDTYADHDRGYYPRSGIVDRAYDPRLAGMAIASIAGHLRGEQLTLDETLDGTMTFRSTTRFFMYQPDPQAGGGLLERFLAEAGGGARTLELCSNRAPGDHARGAATSMPVLRIAGRSA